MDSFELFSNSSLFRGLKEEERKLLFSVSKEVSLEQGDFLLREGEKANELFIVIEGKLEVSKYDPEMKQTHVINIVQSGDTLGEVSLLDHGLRAASIQAITPCRLRSISFEHLHAMVEKNKDLASIFLRLSENVGQRLRHSNDVAIQALRKEVQGYKTRASMGAFLMCIITALSLFTFALGGLSDLLKVVPNSTYITLPLTLGMGIFILLMIQFFEMPLREMGITTERWKQSLFEGIVFTIPVGVISASVMKWFLMTYVPHFQGRPFFDPFALIQNPENRNWTYWLELNSVYWFIIVPVQELLSRGGLQGLLEKFLIGKHKVFLSILMSNLLFSSVHVFFSVEIAIVVFFVGCFIGFIFSRTHNLLGCWISHVILGTLGLSILGLVGGIFE